jgi:hypothetical protein
MNLDSKQLRQIDWEQLIPALRLFRCQRLALGLGQLALVALGLIVMSAGWRFFSGLYSSSTDEVVVQYRDTLRAMPWEWTVFQPSTWSSSFLLPDVSDKLLAAAKQLFNNQLTLSGWVYFLLCTAWAITVWSIIGAAITRMAALRLTRNEKVTAGAAWSYGWERWTSYVAGPVMIIGGALLIAVPLMLAGLVARFDFGALLVSLGWPLMILLGVALAVLTIGASVGWPLMWATISVEGTDAFDGISRTFSYIFNRPMRTIAYVMLSSFIGLIAVAILAVIVKQFDAMLVWGISLGAGSERAAQLIPGTENTADGALLAGAKMLIRFFSGIIKLVPLAYAVNFFWYSATQIYLLLRNAEDGAEFDEVFVGGNAAAFGLPALKTDENGVPRVDDSHTSPGNSRDESITDKPE